MRFARRTNKIRLSTITLAQTARNPSFSQRPSLYDVASIGIALLGLIVSGITAYYALFRTKVSVQAHVVGVNVGPNNSTATIALINLGTNSVSITDATLHLRTVYKSGKSIRTTQPKIGDTKRALMPGERELAVGEPYAGSGAPRAPIILQANSMAVIAVSSLLNFELVKLTQKDNAAKFDFLDNRINIALTALEASGKRLTARLLPLSILFRGDEIVSTFEPQLISLSELE